MYRYSKKRLDDRAIDELIGLSKGIIADKIVNQDEATFLQGWMEANVPCVEDMMVNQLYRRIHEMLIDGILDQEEQQELLELLQQFTGENTQGAYITNLTTTLPFDDPAPAIDFEGATFCLTGTFVFGPRKACTQLIEDQGGIVKKTVTKELDYLVCGHFCTNSWVHSSYGRKIEAAIENRAQLGNPFIISEDHWGSAVFPE